MAVTPVDLKGAKILVTGPTGQVAAPVLDALCDVAELTALARFSDKAARLDLEKRGIHTVRADLADMDSLAACPQDFDYVLNFAVVKTGLFDYDLAANGEGVGNLMAHCRNVKAFLHLSSTAVYQYAGHSPRCENDALGDNHRAMFPTYSIAKIAAETVCRFAAHQFKIPTTIARLSVPYGNNGGWPYFHLLMMKENMAIDLHPDAPNNYNLLHSDDYVAKIPYLLAAATPEVTTTNFGGSQAVSIEEWCDYLAELTGFTPRFQNNSKAFGSLSIDTGTMHALIGETRVDWRQGIREMVRNMAPDLLLKK
ncbi:nucleoside-diphosphate-sugar epimerase [Zhongshania antarctica]|uniref:Nucleoside-diphosphate-sugar epimerase n=1 Tax=Zhongshania antarctica TaxID=641702 RepID=A0A840R1L5_9GAMM|nr:NAD(P)-dependent oxidoreductase [Zhongshania antarctica]MBB5186945.1 nucleoside-diphosphate-sugar epimerase [Zhongshania antarctica]